MGNTAMKSEADFIEVEKDLNTDANFSVGIKQSSADTRSLTTVTLSETLYPTEDAFSITSDSTASITEYESANESETSCNRLSSCTDISYDIPFDGKPNEKVSSKNERQSKLVDETVSQVSRSCISPSEMCDAKQREISDMFEHELPAFNLHANVSEDIVLNKKHQQMDDLALEKQATNETKEMICCRNSSADIENIVSSAVFPNSVICQQWINIEELSRETNLLRKDVHYNTHKRLENDRKRLKRMNKSKTMLKNRNMPVKNSIVYNNVFIHTYDPRFNQNLEFGNKKKTDFSYLDQIGDVLSEALNKVADLMDDFTVQNRLIQVPEAWTKFDEHFSLYDADWVILLNTRARYSDFFEFNYADVLIQFNKDLHKVEEKFIKQFFNNVMYIQMLNDIEFYMISCVKRLRYVAKIPALDKNVNDVRMVPPIELKAHIEENENSLLGIEYVEMENKANFEFKKDWPDLCSISSENVFEFPSLRSEIIECAFQLERTDSQIMSYNENISEAGPVTAADIDNINCVPFLNDSSELEFISKVGGTGLVADNLRKQSLYVKFDPLVADEANATLPNGDSTLKLDEKITCNNNEQQNDVLINSNSEDKNSSTEVTDTKSNESGSVGKLISVTPNKSPRKKKNKTLCEPTEESEPVITPRSSPRFLETDPDDVSKLQSLLLRQIKKEEAFKEELEAARRDYDLVVQKLQSTEKEMDQLRLVLKKGEENEKKLKNEIKELVKSKQQISVILGDYEKAISQMLNKREEEKKENETMIKKIEAERDSTVQHLNNLENAFNDIHQKYERGKAVNEALKKNEDLLKKSLNEYETTVKTVENKYELLKSHATSQLEKANQELELITQSHEKEQAKLKAMLRKSEIQINSLQNALDRKTKENQELTAICDELIMKLSTHSNA